MSYFVSFIDQGFMYYKFVCLQFADNNTKDPGRSDTLSFNYHCPHIDDDDSDHYCHQLQDLDIQFRYVFKGKRPLFEV